MSPVDVVAGIVCGGLFIIAMSFLYAVLLDNQQRREQKPDDGVGGPDAVDVEPRETRTQTAEIARKP